MEATYVPAYVERGIVRQQSGDQKGALVDFDMAIAIDPSYVRALNARGTLLMEMDKIDEAIADFDNAIHTSCA